MATKKLSLKKVKKILTSVGLGFIGLAYYQGKEGYCV
jgi:hypothetical protein